MHCPKCGTELPDYAEFCYECGTKVGTNSDSDYALSHNNKTVKLKKILLVIWLLFLAYSFYSCFGSRLFGGEKIPTENTVVLRGELVVGEDLEPGTYDIRGAGKSHYIFMLIKTGSSEDRINTYNAVHNYRLKEGYIIESTYEAAFTKID